LINFIVRILGIIIYILIFTIRIVNIRKINIGEIFVDNSVIALFFVNVITIMLAEKIRKIAVKTAMTSRSVAFFWIVGFGNFFSLASFEELIFDIELITLSLR